MAITNSDGSIILSTKVDTSGIRKGMSQIKSDAGGLTKAFGKLASAIGVAFSVATVIQFSRESAKFATQTEASVQRLIDIYGQASDAGGDFIDANARALGMSKAAAASYASIYGNLFSVWADQKTNAQLTNHYLNMTAVVASKTGRTVSDVQERIRSGLLGNTEAIEDLGIFVNVKTIEITEAFQRIANGRSWEQLTAYEQSQVRTLAILEQSTKKYGTEVANTTQSVRLKFQAAYEDFKNTWGQLVNTILIPVLSTLTKIFSVATAVINTLTGNTGGILGDSSQADTTGQIRDNIAESTENQKEFTGEIEETNKELKKTLAGFDDLQILSSNATEKEEVEIPAPGISGDGNALGIPSLPQVGGQDNFNPMAVVEKIKEALDFILPVISISLVVIGLILLSAGQIGWGLGFIIGGAYLYSVTERSGDKGFDFSVIKSDLDAILPYIDEALVAIGLLLMFLGQIPIGIGFIIAGAVVYAVQEVSEEDYDGQDVISKLAVITEAVAVSLVAIGIILMFFGNFPLGLGFIVAGAGLLKVSEEKLQEGQIQTKIQKFFSDFREYIEIASWAMVALGFVLILFGQFGFGFALIISGLGIAGVTEAVLDGEALLNKIEEICGKIKEKFLATVNTVIGYLNVLGLGIDPIYENRAAEGFGRDEILGKTSNLPKTKTEALIKAQQLYDTRLPTISSAMKSIPGVATGAFIPTNKNQNNYVSNDGFVTESIIGAVNSAIAQNFASRNTEVVLEVDGREFGRAVVEQGNMENRRIGTRMVIN